MDSQRAGCSKSYGFRVCTLYTHNQSTEKKEGGERSEEGRREEGGKERGGRGAGGGRNGRKGRKEGGRGQREGEQEERKRGRKANLPGRYNVAQYMSHQQLPVCLLQADTELVCSFLCCGGQGHWHSEGGPLPGLLEGQT